MLNPATKCPYLLMANHVYECSVSIELKLRYVLGCIDDVVTEQRLDETLREHFLPCTHVIIEEDKLAAALRALDVLSEKLRAIAEQGRDTTCKVAAVIGDQPCRDAVLESQKERVGQLEKLRMENVSTLENLIAVIDRLVYGQAEQDSRLKRLAGIEEEKPLRIPIRDERGLKDMLAITRIA
jgi:hypothetical protein